MGNPLGGVLVVWALVEAVRVRSVRWSLTILVLPVLGAIAWFVAGRGLYKNAEQATSSALEDALFALAAHFREHGDTHRAQAVEGALGGDKEQLPRRVLHLFQRGMGGLLDAPLYHPDGRVDGDATTKRDILADQLFEAARSRLR